MHEHKLIKLSTDSIADLHAELQRAPVGRIAADILKHSADAANYLMMVTDVTKALRSPDAVVKIMKFSEMLEEQPALPRATATDYILTHNPEMCRVVGEQGVNYASGFLAGLSLALSVINAFGLPVDLANVLSGGIAEFPAKILPSDSPRNDSPCWLCAVADGMDMVHVHVNRETPHGPECDPKDVQVHPGCHQDMEA